MVPSAIRTLPTGRDPNSTENAVSSLTERLSAATLRGATAPRGRAPARAVPGSGLGPGAVTMAERDVVARPGVIGFRALKTPDFKAGSQFRKRP